MQIEKEREREKEESSRRWVEIIFSSCLKFPPILNKRGRIYSKHRFLPISKANLAAEITLLNLLV